MSGITLELTKGSRVDLTKDKPGLTKIVVGLGWDINSGNAGDYDLDAMAFHLKDGKIHDQLIEQPNGEKVHSGIVYYGNKKIAGIELDKDNRTGAGAGDDEKMFLDLAAVPLEVTELMIGVNIYQADSKHQNFGMVNNAYMRIFDPETNEVYVKYDLTEDYSTATAIKIAKIYRKDGEWKVQGVGEGANGTVQDIANSLS
jgi:tellurium resistance protein TerD